MVYKFLLRLDFSVHNEQTSAGDTGAGQTSAGAGRLGKGWTTSAGAEDLCFLVCLLCFSPKKFVVDRPVTMPSTISYQCCIRCSYIKGTLGSSSGLLVTNMVGLQQCIVCEMKWHKINDLTSHFTRVHITLSYGCIVCDTFQNASMTMQCHKETHQKNQTKVDCAKLGISYLYLIRVFGTTCMCNLLSVNYQILYYKKIGKTRPR